MKRASKEKLVRCEGRERKKEENVPADKRTDAIKKFYIVRMA